MAYFLPSYFQKRILRYALSRFDFLDADLLNLDKFDVTWGKRSVVELRDVGLNLKKLSSLLNLPPQFVLVKASIRLLRMTIPADLYHSGILTEVEDVEVQITTDGEPVESLEAAQQKLREPNTPSFGTPAPKDASRSLRPQIHDPGGHLPGHFPSTSARDGDQQSGVLPSTDDLAQSFLDDEPQEKKAQLQAAVGQSQSLMDSQGFNASEDDSSVGVGNGLSLPGFLSDFLKGIGDRFRCSIERLKVDLILRVDMPRDISMTESTVGKLEKVVLRLLVKKFEYWSEASSKSVPHTKTDQSYEMHTSDSTVNPEAVLLKRRFKLGQIRGIILSDTSVFSSLSQPVSRSTTSDSCLTSFISKEFAKAPSRGYEQTTDSVVSDHGNTLGPLKDGTPLVCLPPDANSAQKVSLPGHKIYPEHHQRSWDFAVPTTISSSGAPASTQSPSSSSSMSKVSNMYGNMCDDLDRAGIQKRDFSRSSAIGLRDSGPEMPVLSDQDTTVRTTSESPDSNGSLPNSSDYNESLVSHGKYARELPADDLAESKIFSHEEAESMYMSALSDMPLATSSNERAIPGAWSQDTESNESPLANLVWSTERRIDQSSSHDSTLPQDPAPASVLVHRSTPEVSTERAHNSQTVNVEDTNEAYQTIGASSDKSPLSQASDSSEATSDASLIVAKPLVLVDHILFSFNDVNSSRLRTTPTKATESSRISSTSAPHEKGLQARSQHATVSANNIGTERGDPAVIPESATPFAESHSRISVEIGHADFKADMSVARLTALILQRIGTLTSSKVSQKDRNPKVVSPHEIQLMVELLTWNFLDRVSSLSNIENSGFDPSIEADLHGSELLLQATVQGLNSTSMFFGDSYNSKASIARIVFGYASGDIISFISTPEMRESTRDSLALAEACLVLTVSKDTRVSKMELRTLPVNISLDLRRLDETFAWLGGFSSILDLGNSMISTVTALDQKSPKSRSVYEDSRVVRFETASPERSNSRNTLHSHISRKFTARIGGLTCILQGTESSLRLEGTALKIVSRVEGLGVQIDRLILSGLSGQTAQPAMTFHLMNIRVEYLSEPKEVDLARLLALLSPSRDKYEVDDDILLDTLLRQRRHGSVLRITAEDLDARIINMTDLQRFPTLADELKKLATVAKYLPEDDRPGILTLLLLRQAYCQVRPTHSIGFIESRLKNVEIAHVTLPSLIALGILEMHVLRNGDEELLGSTFHSGEPKGSESPMLMGRFIGNEMEPVVKLKVQHMRVEYHIPFIMALLDVNNNKNAEELLADMAESVATLTQRKKALEVTNSSNSDPPKTSGMSVHASTPVILEVTIQDSLVGLNPRSSNGKGLVLLTETRFRGSLPEGQEANATLEIRKATLMVIDNEKNTSHQASQEVNESPKRPLGQTHQLEAMGFVPVCSISAAKVSVQIVHQQDTDSNTIDVEIKDNLFVVESCADSTQTLQTLFNGLLPPRPPSKGNTYRTEIVPIEDMLSSFSGNAFISKRAEGNLEEEDVVPEIDRDLSDDDDSEDLDMLGSFYDPEIASQYGAASGIMSDSDSVPVSADLSMEAFDCLPPSSESMGQSPQEVEGHPLDFQDEHFASSTSVGGTAHRWNTKYNTYGLTNESAIQRSPLRVRVRNVHVIWNLFDGYDWQHTRDTISKAIADIEIKALDRLSKREKRKSHDVQDEDESVIGDFLFNSIYIGIPASKDPRSLSRQVAHDLDDVTSEAGSSTTSTVTSSPGLGGYAPRAKRTKPGLARSKYHKMTFELKGISADLVVFPSGLGETQSSLDVRVQDLEIFDHVPTSTWKKFATYMYDAGERESGSDMIHLEILNVRPVMDLMASEIILKATILPVRLHVDQDALDFMTRFFDFKDDSATLTTPKAETAFLQRVEINSVRLKLDFKPKRVDYAGIRSGRTNEFMNFFILDRADMVLRHVIIYGISGFDRLGKTLNDIWMPDIKKNQLPGVLAGLAPVRSLVNVGGGVRDLVVVPIREYQKDGRIVRSLQKGALAFAKTTTGEIVKLGAKLAVGTQTVLQGAETLFAPAEVQQAEVAGGWEETEIDEEEKKQISLYADQPLGVIQGLRGAYASLERDLLTAKDAIVAMPGEIMESGTAGGAARVLLKGAPTVILRPALGVTKAVGQTLMGATNSLDPANRRRIEEHLSVSSRSGFLPESFASPNHTQELLFVSCAMSSSPSASGRSEKTRLTEAEQKANHRRSEANRREKVHDVTKEMCILVGLPVEDYRKDALVVSKFVEAANKALDRRRCLIEALAARGVDAERDLGITVSIPKYNKASSTGLSMINLLGSLTKSTTAPKRSHYRKRMIPDRPLENVSVNDTHDEDDSIGCRGSRFIKDNCMKKST
ncbi:MAG: hypothetical protein Q9220_002609 [cf. Caloplaca sp. 1 TL-2023]